MYGTLAGALSGRKVRFDRSTYTATADGRIVNVGKIVRIESIVLHYTLTIPAEDRQATERALHAHPEGCPAHMSVRDAIKVTWDAQIQAGDEKLSLASEA